MKHLFALLLLISLSLKAQVASDTTTLDKVEVLARKQSKQLTIGGNIKKNSILQPYSSEWDMLAKLFPYKEDYAETPYLQSIEVPTRNRSALPAQFNLHLYKMGKDSLPGEELVPGGVSVTAKRGRKTTTADVASYNITMPKEGLIVAFEWIRNDNNLYPYEATGKVENGKIVMAKKEERALIYAPDIYCNDIPQPISYYYKGHWHKFLMNQWALYSGNWKVPAINVTLSN